MPTQAQIISIVIPVYNEAGNIEPCLRELSSVLIDTPYEVLICYDFDEDNTLTAIASMPDKPAGVRFVKNTLGKGPANAIQAGFAASRGDVIVTMMADLSDEPHVIPQMAKKVREEGCTVVSGSRYMKGGGQVGGPRSKRLLSWMAGFLLHIMGLGTRDATSNFRAYSTDFLSQTCIQSCRGFEIALELTVKAFKNDRKICEVPTVWHDRTSGNSRFQLFKWMPHYLKWFFAAVSHSLNRNGFFIVLSLLFIIIAAIITGHTVYSIYEIPNDVYFWDEWELVRILDKFTQGNLPFADLFAQHNEHRPLFLKLIYLADALLFSGKNRLLLTVIIFNQLLIALLFCRLARLTQSNWFQLLWFYALVFICLFSGIQGENLFWPFQAGFVGAQLGVVVGIYSVFMLSNRSGKKRRIFFLLAAIAGALYAEFSLASGILAWPMILLMAGYNRIDYKYFIAILLSSIFFISIYFIDYHTPSHLSNPLRSLQHIKLLFHYILCYIGNPMHLLKNGTGGPAVFGLLGISAFGIYLIKYGLVSKRFSPQQTAFIMIALYVLATASVTSLGRIKFGLSQAFAFRYWSISILFWLSLIYLYFHDLFSERRNNPWAVSVFLVFVLFFFGMVGEPHFRVIKSFKSITMERQLLGEAIVRGYEDSQLLVRLYVHEGKVRRGIDVLKREKKGMFSVDRQTQASTISESVSLSTIMSGIPQHSFINGHQCRIFKNDSGIVIESSGTDPQFTIPEVCLTNGRLKWLKINISAPQETSLQVFYECCGASGFKEENSTRQSLGKGENDITIILPFESEGRVRLDPGMVAGTYIIKNFSFGEFI